jgi:hypothetical protein
MSKITNYCYACGKEGAPFPGPALDPSYMLDGEILEYSLIRTMFCSEKCRDTYKPKEVKDNVRT